jgi:hypothetical protein
MTISLLGISEFIKDPIYIIPIIAGAYIGEYGTLRWEVELIKRSVKPIKVKRRGHNVKAKTVVKRKVSNAPHKLSKLQPLKQVKVGKGGRKRGV